MCRSLMCNHGHIVPPDKSVVENNGMWVCELMVVTLISLKGGHHYSFADSKMAAIF
jgi:hypothetical protein